MEPHDAEREHAQEFLHQIAEAYAPRTGCAWRRSTRASAFRTAVVQVRRLAREHSPSATRSRAILFRFWWRNSCACSRSASWAFMIVYLIADFSDRIDDFLKHQAPIGAIVRYFL